MEQLRKALATIAKGLSQMNTTQKLLIASIAIIIFMGLFVVSQYAGKQDMVPALPGASVTDQAKFIEVLDQTGIKYTRSSSGTVMVPVQEQQKARAAIIQAGQMPADAALLFKNIVEKQSWQLSRQQNEQLFTIALQNELSATISHFSGVDHATVIIDAPGRQGLGASVPRPTASATVFTKGGAGLTQATVDAVAHLVAGAKAGLSVENVRVIDGSTGRQRKPTSENDILATTYLEQAARVESQMQAKLMDLFGYIPGRIIAVTAQVDVTRLNSRVLKHYEKGDGTISLPKKTTEQTSNNTEAQPSAEAGLTGNIGADLSRPAKPGPGSKTETSMEERDMDNHVGSRVDDIVDPKGMPTMIAVSVNIPSAYVAGLLKQDAAAKGGGADAKEPTEAEVSAKFDKDVKPGILGAILPHVRAMTDSAKIGDAATLTKFLESQVAVALIPGDIGPMPGGGPGAGGSSAGGGVMGTVMAMGGGMIEKAVLGLLALVSLGLMLTMVKKAARRTELPTAEELVGLPPKLEAPSDMMGEADESDTPLAGIEVGEEEMAANKMLEQVAEMVKQNPEGTAKLLNRWISVET